MMPGHSEQPPGMIDLPERCWRSWVVLLGALTLVGLVSAFAGEPAPSLMEDERNTIEVFHRASRGVVHIEARWIRETRFASREEQSGTGTGFAVDREGRVLTAFHVIDGMNRIDVVLGSGRRLAARLVGPAREPCCA